jgi:hypothetical protein
MDKKTGSKKEVNIVHDEWNWRVRINNETQSAKEWQENWGYFQCAKPEGRITVDMTNSELAHAATKCGVTYDYLNTKLSESKREQASTRRSIGSMIVAQEQGRHLALFKQLKFDVLDLVILFRRASC